MGKHKYSAKRAANSPKNKLERSLAQELPASQSLDDEIHSLVALLNDRAKDLVLRRWGYIEWPIPTLESLGARNGVTRERVRQIVSDHNARLKDLAYEGKIALPFAVSVCGLLLERPGATREELQVDVQASGIPASDSALRTLPALADLGMVPPVYLDSQTELWFSGPRAVEFSDPENPWHGEVRHMLTRSRASVRRTGAVHVSRVGTVPGLDVEDAARILFNGRSTLVDGYLVPIDQLDSVTLRRTRKMLAVSPSLTLDEIRRGLRRTLPRPIRLPVTVLKELLLSLSDFKFENGKVTPSFSIPLEEVLGEVDRDLVNAISDRGGVVTQNEVAAILVSKGHSQSWLQHFHYAPFVVRPSPGMYAIRGRAITRTLDEPRNVGDARRKKERVLVHSHWDSPTDVSLRLRVTRQTIQGVAHLPKRVRLSLPDEATEWQTYSNGEPIAAVSTGGGMLWDLKPFLESNGAVIGEHLDLRINFREHRVDLARIRRDQAIADEAGWLAARVKPVREHRDATGPTQRRIRKQPETLAFRSEDGWISVPYSDVDISKVRYFRVTRPLSHGDQEILVSIFPDFPLAPDTHEVYMGLWCRLPVQRGKRSFSTGLVEKHILERGSELSAAEAMDLLPSLPKRLFLARHALQWREYHPPQLELLLETRGST